MTSPNPALMQKYGTAGVYQDKLAGAASLAERVAGGLLGYGMAAHNQRENDQAAAEGAAMTEMARELELLKVDRYAQLLRGTPVPRFARPSMPFYDLPRGRIDDAQWYRDLDDGSVRLASVAACAGADLAKEAGLGNFTGFMKNIGGALTGLAAQGKSAVGGGLQAISGAGAKAMDAVSGKSFMQNASFGDKLKGRFGMGIKGNLAMAGLAAGGLFAGNKLLQGASRTMGSEASGPTTYGGGQHGFQPANAVNEYGQPQAGTPL